MFKFFGKQIVKPYTHTAKSIWGSGKNIANNFAEMGRLSRGMGAEMRDGIKSLKDQNAQPARDPGKAFQEQYVALGWNAKSLATQRRNIANAQSIYTVGMIISLAVGIWQMNSVSAEAVIVPMVLAMLSLLASTVFFGRIFLMSMYKVQIDTRSLMSWNEFAGRRDFWSNLLNPYRKAPAIT